MALKHVLLVCLLMMIGSLAVLPTALADPGPVQTPLNMMHCEDIPPTTYECIVAYAEWAITLRGQGAINYLCRFYLTGNDCIN